MSDRLVLEDITHRYGREVALDQVSLAIEEGELVTLLGPSGCGKTTLLRIVAGFVRPSEGRVLLEGRDVTKTAPYRRPVNMVFQRSTLFPHLDVFENVAFGLRIAGTARGEVGSRVSDALALVRVAGLRTGVRTSSRAGRCSASRSRAPSSTARGAPLDEPLSALDLRIRLEMEAELRRVHRETGATFVYVTHDQREALALSDRLVVINEGRVEQVGTPDEIYRAPASAFAARFVGNANVIPVDVVDAAGAGATVVVGGLRLDIRRPDGLSTGPAGSSFARRSCGSRRAMMPASPGWYATSRSAARTSPMGSTSRDCPTPSRQRCRPSRRPTWTWGATCESPGIPPPAGFCPGRRTSSRSAEGTRGAVDRLGVWNRRILERAAERDRQVGHGHAAHRDAAAALDRGGDHLGGVASRRRPFLDDDQPAGLA